MAQKRVQALYYITHVNNIPSILGRGILSHEIVEREQVPFTPIYDAQIVANRRGRLTPDGRSLWSFANLYFQPRNPMLYRVIAERDMGDVAIVAVRRDVLKEHGVFITSGNAASPLTGIFPASKSANVASVIRDAVGREWWKEEDGSKRAIMCECLVPEVVRPDYIQSVYVASHEDAEKVKLALKAPPLPVIPEPRMFFQPSRKIPLTDFLSVVEGDMFFSGLQTLTISVNCVGVMGKGLASRAKYQFPDVYVMYQDLCREKKLALGRPYLYKRETSFDYALADEPTNLLRANAGTWFLLFPTKHHWREKSSIDGIEQGLVWLQSNYKEEGITRLAVPALGCGLGGLEWHDVGPIICRQLSHLDIPVAVYLPTEKKVPSEQLRREFLLD